MVFSVYVMPQRLRFACFALQSSVIRTRPQVPSQKISAQTALGQIATFLFKRNCRITSARHH
jgi:hypothetical protein